MNNLNFWQNFVNKQVTFRYMRQELQFNLSQSLFSSADVDIGSRFLLRTLAKNVESAALTSVLDIGCGVGVLGLSLKKINPNIQLIAQDRDALAVTFTAQNALLNGMGAQIQDKPSPEFVEGKGGSSFDRLSLRLVVSQADDIQSNDVAGIVVQGGLAFADIGEQKFDLILSNLPGKAGRTVLQDMLQQMPAHLSETGMAAVVIVKPLADLVAETLVEMESEILLREEASGYEVFHFRGGNVTQRHGNAEDNLEPYIRNEQLFKIGNQKIGMKTAWNLPEFDSLAHDTALAVNALKKKPVTGRVLFWNPRQGHLPMFLREQADEIVLAGRDALSLQIAELNLRETGVENVSSQHVPHFLDVSGQFDWLIIFPDNDPGVAWENALLPHCRSLLVSGGQMLLVAKSAYAHRLLQRKKGLNSKFDRKRNGYRAVIFAKSK